MTDLEDLLLIERRASLNDKRVREATVSERGGEKITLLNAVRERLANRILANWTDADLDELHVLLRRFADDLTR